MLIRFEITLRVTPDVMAKIIPDHGWLPAAAAGDAEALTQMDIDLYRGVDWGVIPDVGESVEVPGLHVTVYDRRWLLGGDASGRPVGVTPCVTIDLVMGDDAPRVGRRWVVDTLIADGWAVIDRDAGEADELVGMLGV